MKKSEISACKNQYQLEALYVKYFPKNPIWKMNHWVNKILNYRKYAKG